MAWHGVHPTMLTDRDDFDKKVDGLYDGVYTV